MTTTTPSKICCICGLDVAQKPRTKDKQGRYYCQPCWDARVQAARGQSATPAAVVPELFVCPICGGQFSQENMDESGTCKECTVAQGQQGQESWSEPEATGTSSSRIPEQQASQGRTELAGDTRDCPFCGETIKAKAVKCRFCGEMLDGSVANDARSCPAPTNFANRDHAKAASSTRRIVLFVGLLALAVLAATGGTLLFLLSGRWEQQNSDRLLALKREALEKSRITAAKTDIANLEVSLDAFEIDNGRHPTNDEKLDALVIQPPNCPNWKGPYIKRGVPNDPWGHPYVYRYPGQHNVNGYDLFSLGTDGRESTDDIDNWSK